MALVILYLREETVKNLKLLVTLAALCLGGSSIVPVTFGQEAAAPAARPYVYDYGNYKTAEDYYTARKAAADAAAAPAKWEALPDWTGLWTRNIAEEGFSTRPGEKRTGVGYQTEIEMKLTPEYQRRYDKTIADFKAGKGDFDPLTLCLPAGYPRWHVEPFLKEFIVRPEMTLLINEQQSEVRRIYTDGRPHLSADETFPMWEGDSIGFWDGATLVIWTNSNKGGIYQRQQPEYSDAVETVEEWTEIEPGVMEVKMTIFDEKALQEPFPLVRYFYRTSDEGGSIRVSLWNCNENQNVVRTEAGNSDFVLPGEDGYKPPVGNEATPEALLPSAIGN